MAKFHDFTVSLFSRSPSLTWKLVRFEMNFPELRLFNPAEEASWQRTLSERCPWHGAESLEERRIYTHPPRTINRRKFLFPAALSLFTSVGTSVFALARKVPYLKFDTNHLEMEKVYRSAELRFYTLTIPWKNSVLYELWNLLPTYRLS